MIRHKLKICLSILFIATNFHLGNCQKKEIPKLKKFNWAISDWKKVYSIKIPVINYVKTIFMNGNAKSITFFYADSSSIHILIDPDEFDKEKRQFIYTDYIIKNESSFSYLYPLEILDSSSVYNLKIYQGIVASGKKWKEVQYPKIKICYINVSENKVLLYETAINSFRIKK